MDPCGEAADLEAVSVLQSQAQTPEELKSFSMRSLKHEWKNEEPCDL